MSTTALSTRHPRGINSKGRNLQQSLRKNGFKLPEYLEMAEVNALIAGATNRPGQCHTMLVSEPRREEVHARG